MKKYFCLLLALALALSLLGCSAPPDEETAAPTDAGESATGGTPSEAQGQADFVPCPMEVNRDTAARTSSHEVIETENGYYAQFDGTLYYADKADLTNWVTVCNQPNCTHTTSCCPADIGHWPLYLEDGRLYMMKYAMEITIEAGVGLAVYSMAADGTDLQLVYPIDLVPGNTGWGMSDQPTATGHLLSTSVLMPDGNYQYSLSVLEKDGLHILYQETMDDQYTDLTFLDYSGAYGDFVFRSQLLDRSGAGTDVWYRITEEDAYEVVPGLEQYNLYGTYLSGNHLYRFVSNDGYYCTDLSTGASVKWMDAQMADSRAFLLGTDFLVETNMRYDAAATSPELRIYSGGTWKSVVLPAGFWPEGEVGEYGMQMLALTTRHLFLQVNHMGGGFESALYAIDLTADNLEAVFCAEF